jgi:hypothetical protein
MTKVVYNACYGGFSISEKAAERLVELGMTSLTENIKIAKEACIKSSVYTSDRDLPRHHPLLVQVVEELGEEANGGCAKLKIANVYGRYKIDEYDGMESVITPDSIADEWIRVDD